MMSKQVMLRPRRKRKSKKQKISDKPRTLKKKEIKQDKVGYDINIFMDVSAAAPYICHICKKISRNPVELSCHNEILNEDDEDSSNDPDQDDHDVLYCQSCLVSYLSVNNKQCPINSDHQNTNYNVARYIRKQINNLSVYCPNHSKLIETTDTRGNSEINETHCDWSGKLSKLSSHLKCCKFTQTYCKICKQVCEEETIDQHNKNCMAQHISIIYSKYNQETNTNTNTNNELPDIDITNEINEIISENKGLKLQIQSMQNDWNEWKITFNIESTKKELIYKSEIAALQTQNNQQSQSMQVLMTKNSELMARSESQQQLIDKLMVNYTELQSELNKIQNSMELPSKMVTLPSLNDSEENNNLSMDNLCNISDLARASSMIYYHPDGIEDYHPSPIKYEMYHPSKSSQVWVSKNIGSMTKIRRYSCCGSAKHTSIYLKKAEDTEQLDEVKYIAVEDDDYDELPDYWFDGIHLGCTENKRKNKKNKSFYECCNGNILSNGCRKRYKCCEQDIDESEGCKVGWSC